MPKFNRPTLKLGTPRPAFTVTVPSTPGQPADHYEGPEYGGDRPGSDPSDDTYTKPNDPTDDDFYGRLVDGGGDDLDKQSEGFDRLETTGGF